MTASFARRGLVFLAIACVGCTLDLAVKSRMFPDASVPYPNTQPDWYWKDVAGIQVSLNEGALFGVGQGFWPLFAGLSVLAGLGIVLWFCFARASCNWLLTVALGFVMAGIVGNLYDRLGLPGLVWNGLDGVHVAGQSVHAVRDYVLVMIGAWHWPNFNIADSCLVAGAILLFWHAMYPKREAETSAVETCS